MSESVQTAAAPANQALSEASAAVEALQTQETSENSQEQSDTTASLQEKAANGTPQEKKEAKKTLKKLALKVDGESFEEELPFEIEDRPEIVDWMKKQLQLSKVSSKRMNEYSQLEKEVRQFVDELKKNPRKVLSDPNIGLDIKKLASEIIEEEIENSQKTPEQLEKEKIEAELKALKEEREKEKEEAKQKEFERIQEREYERYDTLISKALETSDLPKSPYVLKKMTDYLMLGIQNNIDIEPADVLPMVREEILEDIKSMFSVMPEDVIENIVGKETLNKIRKKNLKKAKETPPMPVNKAIQDTGKTESAEKAPEKKVSFKEFFSGI